MKFTPKETIKHAGHIFEAGNTYNGDLYGGVSDADVEAFHGAGWVEVDGFDPAPDRVVTGAVVSPRGADHASISQEI